jgi:hypothetical protein
MSGGAVGEGYVDPLSRSDVTEPEEDAEAPSRGVNVTEDYRRPALAGRGPYVVPPR